MKTQKALNMNSSAEDAAIIIKIAQRASKAAATVSVKYTVQDAQMDVTATHLNGLPLDLQGLLEADDRDFYHDIFDIRRYLNRDTGKMVIPFVPRYAK